MAGTENQCLGIAEALNIRPVIKRIGLRQPWKFLSPWLGFEGSYSFTGDKLGPPWPDLLLASGRKSVAAARYIKKASGGKTFAVQIQDPRIDPACFDLVAVPAHDPARGDNVLVTTAAPNRLPISQVSAPAPAPMPSMRAPPARAERPVNRLRLAPVANRPMLASAAPR